MSARRGARPEEVLRPRPHDLKAGDLRGQRLSGTLHRVPETNSNSRVSFYPYHDEITPACVPALEERDELSGGEAVRLVRDFSSFGSRVVAGALCSSKVFLTVASVRI